MSIHKAFVPGHSSQVQAGHQKGLVRIRTIKFTIVILASSSSSSWFVRGVVLLSAPDSMSITAGIFPFLGTSVPQVSSSSALQHGTSRHEPLHHLGRCYWQASRRLSPRVISVPEVSCTAWFHGSGRSRTMSWRPFLSAPVGGHLKR